MLYYCGKVVDGVYDNRLLVKPTKSALALLPNAPRELTHAGAKEMLLVEDVENRDMKKLASLLVLMLALLMLCSCVGYVKSYSATVLITACQGDKASMKFSIFKGSYHFKLKGDGAAEVSQSTYTSKKGLPHEGAVLFWRRRWDLNPRAALTAYEISSHASSTT